MLAPHDREDPELGEVRIAAQDFFNAFEFVRGETVLRDEFRSDGWSQSQIRH